MFCCSARLCDLLSRLFHVVEFYRMRVGMGCEMLIRSCRTQDLDKDDYIPEPYRKATAEEVHALHKKELQTRKHWDRVKQRKLQELGFEVEHTGEIIL